MPRPFGFVSVSPIVDCRKGSPYGGAVSTSLCKSRGRMISAPTAVDISLIEEAPSVSARARRCLYMGANVKQMCSVQIQCDRRDGACPVRLVLMRLCIGFADSGLPQGQSLRFALSTSSCKSRGRMISAPTAVDISSIGEEPLRLGSRETAPLYGSQREADMFSSNSMRS